MTKSAAVIQTESAPFQMFDPAFEKGAAGSPIRASLVTSPSGGRAIDFVFRQRGELLVRSFWARRPPSPSTPIPAARSFFGEVLQQNVSAILAAERLRPGDQCPQRVIS
jgi:hypothetical protein